MAGYVDSLSISMNAPTKEMYSEIVRPCFGLEAFDVVLKFAEDAKSVIEDITLTVVDVMTKEQVSESRKIAEDRGFKFRVRAFIK